ncbi:MAG: ABC transporter permease, partial [Inconstantimicrobium porci]|nr:ABC transporter permease [Inconstantimicrobium porci]
VTMLIYFGAMMVSGMFGVKVDKLAKPLRYVAYLLPTTYISQDFIDFWQSGSYNFAPFVQSVIFVAVVGVLVLSYALYKNSRTANA